MSKVLGIDYGRRRIGLAISDQTRTIASPIEPITVKNARAAIPLIKRIVAENSVAEIAVGLPLNQHGDMGDMAREVDSWSGSLRKAVAIPVSFVDERFSSQWADRVADGSSLGRDSLSAQAILETFLQSAQHSQ